MPRPVRLRITKYRLEDQNVLCIEGDLADEGLPELERALQGVSGPLVLDLENLVRIDPAAIARLRELEARGAELRGVTPYCRLLLCADRPSCGTSRPTPSGRTRTLDDTIP